MFEKILEEIEQRISHYRNNATAECVDVCAGLREAARIIRKHMNKKASNGDLISRQALLDDFRKTITEKSDTIDWLNMIARQKVVSMNDDWIPCEERMPTKEEYLKDDGRFILDDGNRRYQGLFDIYDGKFKFSKHISGIHYELFEDNCVIAWQPLPKPYMPKKGPE